MNYQTSETLKHDIQKYAVLFALWALVVLMVIMVMVYETNEQSAVPETTIEVYRHYTVISHRNGHSSEVTTIMADDTFSGIACDGWEPENEEGHNCVLVGHDSLTEFLKLVNLDKVYTIRSAIE